jgi:HAD superfamily hydrolase (TIGR01509 family)
MKALIFDVDGTLAETEDSHRQSFNTAFRARGLPWHWDVELNRELLAVSGGTERLGAFQMRLPEAERLTQAELVAIHKYKRRVYMELLAEGALTPREGVQDLIEAARSAGLALAVVTAASAESLAATFAGYFGRPPEEMFDVVVNGDDVSAKKPDPEGYLMALARLGRAPDEVLVFEDSPVGFAAARAAGLPTVVTPSDHGPRGGDFNGAVAVLPSLVPEHWPRFGFPPAAVSDQK